MGRLARTWAVICALLGSLAPSGCSQGASSGPESSLSQFLDLMERGRNDSRALREAYTLLDEESQAALRARADKARTLARRDFEPWQMIAQGRYRLRFAPTPSGMTAEIDGNRARVMVRGADGQRVEVPMIKQGGRWRVRLHLEPLGAAPLTAPATRDEPGGDPGERHDLRVRGDRGGEKGESHAPL